MEELAQKIIIDTDIGDDIDDAFALAFAVNSPELDLVGVTTVFRNCELRAKMARNLLDSYGRGDIPVCAGVDIPLLEGFRDTEKDTFDPKGRLIPCQYEPTDMDPYTYSQEWGPDFIIRKVLENPHEIVLVPIGPLTNIALAIRKCPDIVPLIKKIVLMGGYMQKESPEWNILCDPEAAQIVYSSGAELYAVGLDVTLQCSLTRDQVKQFEQLDHQGSQVLAKMMHKWMNRIETGTPVLHDPLTVGCVIDPSFVAFSDRRVRVLLDRDQRGCTVSVPAEDPKGSFIRTGEVVEKDRYMEFFQSRVITSMK